LSAAERTLVEQAAKAEQNNRDSRRPRRPVPDAPAVVKEPLHLISSADPLAKYELVYHPSNPKQDGTYRAIRVRATSPDGGDLAVTTRAGYVARLKPASTTANAGKPEARN